MVVAIILLSLVFLLLIIEKYFVTQQVNRIKIRVHVNGTRGKSSVTEYIAAGLRGDNYNAISKITGVLPTVFFSNTVFQIINRKGPARVQEQVKIINLTVSNKSEALVLECMSIFPELQIMESRIFKPQIYVITNIREDHLEQMGKTIEQEVESICSAIPKDSLVVTSEKKYFKEITSFASIRNSKVISAEPLDYSLSAQLPPGVFESNVALAVKVCEILKIDSSKSFHSVCDYAVQKKSAMIDLKIGDFKVKFLNGFAVNDVQSANDFLNYWQKQLGNFREIIILLNVRADRPLRSVGFAKWLTNLKNLKSIILVGTHVPKTKRLLYQYGLQQDKILPWSKGEIDNIGFSLESLVTENTVIIGIGNIADDGFKILNSIERANYTMVGL
jgi:gamma-polyglutamate synthase